MLAVLIAALRKTLEDDDDDSGSGSDCAECLQASEALP